MLKKDILLSFISFVLLARGLSQQRAPRSLTPIVTGSPAVTGGGLHLVITTTAASCSNNSNGSILVTASGGTPPYVYSFRGEPFQSSALYLASGPALYSIEVLDAAGVTASASASISNNLPKVFVKPFDYTLATTCAASDGTVTLTGSDGVPPYRYSMDGVNYQSSNIFTNLTPGAYYFFIKDQTGCTGNYWFPLTGDCINHGFSILISYFVCTTGSIFVTPLGDLDSLSYSLDGINYQSDPNFRNLAPGVYTVRIKKDKTVLYLFTTYIYHQCLLSLNSSETNASCGITDGTVSVTASNGSPPYQYSIDGIHFQNENAFKGLSPGNYTIIAEDANGVLETTSTVVGGACPVVKAVARSADCGNYNGGITARVIGGATPYLYSIDGIHFQGSNSYSGLMPGNYTITVKDANGILANATCIVGNEAGPEVSAFSSAASCINHDGTITLSANGGITPYQYTINGSDYQDSESFTSLASGNYQATVQDGSGCLATATVAVPINNNLLVDAGNNMTSCEGAPVSINASSNGATFSWTPDSGLDNPTTLAPKATPSTTTTYTLAASLGICQKTGSMTVFISPAPIAHASPPDSAICSGQSLTLHGNGGVAYAWSPSAYLDDPNVPEPTAIKPVSTITYHLRVTDAKGCGSVKDAAATVTVTPPGRVFAGNDTSILASQSLQLHAVDIDHVGYTQFSWLPVDGLSDPASQDPVATIGKSTEYTVVATTSNGCGASGSMSIKLYSASDMYVPNGFTPNGDGHNDRLHILPVGIKEFRYFAVFNRAGQRVFFATNPNASWDGTFRNHPEPPGAYVWMAGGINYKGDLIERRGTLLLIR